MPEAPTDVLIRGAGPVGATLALALRDSALRVALLQRDDPPSSHAFRPIALSYSSRLILDRLGVWRNLPAARIARVRVSQSQSFGRTRLEASDAGVPALGYVVEYADLAACLRSALQEGHVELTHEERVARCEVHAEGWSDASEKRYAQDAVVARVFFESGERDTAHERFTPEGPLAVLPLERGSAVIWSVQPARAQALASGPDKYFLRALAELAPREAGTPVAVEERSTQALALRVRRTRVEERHVYIGNAAQTLHPVAGQGLNLGLRDAWDLAQILRDADDPGERSILARYAAGRRLDARATIQLTDGLARAFLGSGRLAAGLRGAALTALDVLPAPRRFFARRMIYGASALP